MYAITIDVCPKRGTPKRIDFYCMVIVDIYIESLERMPTRWPMGNPTWSTNLPIPKVTSSINCQLASKNTETMLVVCYYLMPPQRFTGTSFLVKLPRLILEFICNGTYFSETL